MKKNIKKVLINILPVALSLFIFDFSYGAKEIIYKDFDVNGKNEKLPVADILLDGETLNTKNLEPLVINNEAFISAVDIAEKLDLTVDWKNQGSKINIKNNYKNLELNLNSNDAKINGKKIRLKSSTLKVNNSFYVPLRLIADEFSLDFNYNSGQNQISINSGKLKKSKIDSDIFSQSQYNKGGFDIEEYRDNIKSEFNVGESILDKGSVNKPIAPVAPSAPIVSNKASGDISSDIFNFDEKFTQEKNKVFDTLNTSNSSKNNTENKLKLSYYLEKGQYDNDEFKIFSSGLNPSYTFFFTKNPKTLVIDVKNGKLDEHSLKSEILNSSIFEKVDATYYEAGNYTRFSIKIRENIDNSLIKVSKNGNVIKAQKVNEYKNSDNLSYEFDRKTGKVNFSLAVEPTISENQNTLTIRFPVNPSYNIKEGDYNFDNRIVTKMNIRKESGDFVINLNLSGRVNYNVNKSLLGLNKITTINFEKKNRKKPLIVLDAGHGGKDIGANAPKYNTNEKTLNIQVVQKLYNKLINKGYTVVLTRSDDTFVPLNDIVKISNDNDPDIFISIHHNSAAPSANGIETYYHISKDSKTLADSVHKNLIKYTSANDRKVKSMPFVVVKKTFSPAILCEVGFITNDVEIRKNISEDYQNKIADGIVKGVDEYFGR